jgi:hypothetical protein
VIATERTAIAIELVGMKLRTPHKELETRPTARSWLTTPVDVLFVSTKVPELTSALEGTLPALLSGSTIVPLPNGVDHLPLCERGTRSLASWRRASTYGRVAPGGWLPRPDRGPSRRPSGRAAAGGNLPRRRVSRVREPRHGHATVLIGHHAAGDTAVCSASGA